MKHKIINNNLRFINWDDGTDRSPGIFNESDFDRIKNSDLLFARKFDENSELLNLIDNKILDL